MTADISTDLSAWSATAGSNQPDYTDAVGPNNLADNLRAIQAAVRLMQSSSTIASATSCDLSTVTSYILTVTGTTTITALGTMSAGIVKKLIFAGVLTFTHNATTLILPTAANITTAADDVATMLSLGSGNWRCIGYTRKSGAALTSVTTFGDGSLSAPGVGFTSDTNTGLFRSTTDTVQLVAGGEAIAEWDTTKLELLANNFFKQTETTGYTKIGTGSGSPGIYAENTASGGIPALMTLKTTAVNSTGVNIAEMYNSGGICFRVETTGLVFADGAYSGSGADFAEWFLPVAGPALTAGDAVSIENGRVKLAGPHDDPIGVISDRPAVIGDASLEAQGGVLVGLVGKLWVKAGSPIGTRWKFLEHGNGQNRYLVR